MQKKPVACQKNIWLLFKQVGLGHLMVEAAGWVVEVLVGEEVDVDTALGFIHLSNLGANECGKTNNERMTERELT